VGLLRPFGTLLKAHHLTHGPRALVFFVWLGGVFAFAALAGVAWAAGPGDVEQLLAAPAWNWLGIAIAAELVAYIGYIAAYREIARLERGPRLGIPHAAALVASGFGMFIPRGGFTADCEALELAGCDRGDARRRVIGLGALEWAALAPAACVAAIVLLVRGSRIGDGVTLPWAIAVPLGFAAALIALRCRGRLGAARWKRPVAHGLDAAASVHGLLARRHGAGALAAMSVYYAAEIFALWACLRIFAGHAPSIPAVLLGYATGYALTRRSLPLAGAGAVEALLPFALLWVNVPLAQAVLAVLFYRVVNLWIPLIPALAGLRTVRRRHGDDMLRLRAQA
jgi:uncharacterized membrane protein YbhN (UPF0104 family)